MALDVKQSLRQILTACGKMSKGEALAYIQQMKRTGRLMEEYFG